MSSPTDDYARSLLSFRPSIYSTGIQAVQPYTPEWPEGSEYGGQTAWYKPWSWNQYIDIDPISGATAGQCKDPKTGKTVDCKDLFEKFGVTEYDDPDLNPLWGDDPPPPPKKDIPPWAIAVGVVATAGLAYVGWAKYQKAETKKAAANQ